MSAIFFLRFSFSSPSSCSLHRSFVRRQTLGVKKLLKRTYYITQKPSYGYDGEVGIKSSNRLQTRTSKRGRKKRSRKLMCFDDRPTDVDLSLSFALFVSVPLSNRVVIPVGGLDYSSGAHLS